MSTPYLDVPPTRHVVVTSTKSAGIQILLIVFLGPLGLFYSTIKGALFMLFGVPVLAAIIAPAIGAMAPTARAVCWQDCCS
jgi:hypothetical protein